MAYPDNLLVTGERVIVNKRPHWKVLILPTILFILIIGAGAALAAWVNSRDMANASWIYWAIVIVGVIALVILVVVPFVRWRTEHFVITNHHVFFRTGLLSRREHQIPLGQIANMETEVTFWGRLMGYGSLIVESSADQPLKFRNVASLSKVQATLNQLIRDERERSHHGGSGYEGGPPAQGYPQGDYQGPPAQQYPQQGYSQQGYPGQQYPAQQHQAPQNPTQRYQAPQYPTQQQPPQAPTRQFPDRTNPQQAYQPPQGTTQGEGRPAPQS